MPNNRADPCQSFHLTLLCFEQNLRVRRATDDSWALLELIEVNENTKTLARWQEFGCME
ncbi:hypothetical protein BDR05DRAFT_969903 [Suillus weaverae]|nr:hypothetical protein BDR05DRAFT_969903 [Suillus weaverae]